VTGMREADARAALERGGLIVGSVSRTKRRDVEPGTVLRQTPGPGESVEKGLAVALDVAIADLRTVPNVVGRSLRDAATALQQDAFKIVTVRESTDDVPSGSVLRQKPAANAQAAPGSTITLTVAVTATIEVPDITRRKRSEALDLLSRSGFVPRVAEQPTDTAPPETVIGQNPPAGTRVRARSEIEVRVAVPIFEGATVTMPRVVGLSLLQATSILQKLSLEARVTEAPTRTPSSEVVVVGQQPAAGVRLRPGSLVELQVQRTPDSTTLPLRPSK
jgi:serine/threonine-protein kinase